MDQLVSTVLQKDSVFAIFAAVFIYLYITEKKAHNDTTKERISDLKISQESVHKSISLLETARSEFHRRSE